MSDTAAFAAKSRIASAMAEMQFARSRVFPILWGQLRGPGPEIVHNGSGFILNCGAGTFGVTAAHVITQLREDLIANPQLQVQLFNLRLDLASRILALNSSLDLATFTISSEELAALGVTPCAPPPTGWPPSTPAVGDQVLLAGFPRGARLPFEGDRQGLGLHFETAKVASAGPTALYLHLDSNDRVDFLGSGYPPANYEIGGLSGAPVFVLVSAKGILHIEVVGLVAEWHASLELLRVNLLAPITPAGSIRA